MLELEGKVASRPIARINKEGRESQKPLSVLVHPLSFLLGSPRPEGVQITIGVLAAIIGIRERQDACPGGLSGRQPHAFPQRPKRHWRMSGTACSQESQLQAVEVSGKGGNRASRVGEQGKRVQDVRPQRLARIDLMLFCDELGKFERVVRRPLQMAVPVGVPGRSTIASRAASISSRLMVGIRRAGMRKFYLYAYARSCF
ncbi:hypothetical protein GCM10027612_87600 [Microbispora bryophytorum subsp. camponoti]